MYRSSAAETLSASDFSSYRPPQSSAYQAALRTISKLARDRKAPILIEGESGTGKTTIARMIHDVSPRRSGSFQHVLLSALDDSLSCAELFGYVQGAFTDARKSRAGHFASASGGTIFLDEIGKASQAVQQRLLHAIEYGEFTPLGSDRSVRVDIRVVAASNVSLSSLVAQQRFLPDLYARLEVFRVTLPPLRERSADISGLVHGYLARHCEEMGRANVPEVCPTLMSALMTAPWPNNLRQLSATIHRLLLEIEDAPVITLGDCKGELEYLRRVSSAEDITTDRILSEIATSGNKAAAARKLGMDRTTLHRRLKKRDEER